MFSQNSEERYILSACDFTGTFLDIGAWHAFDKSNVRALYERGWSGVLVEPSPGPFKGLVSVYGEDPRVSLVNAAIGFEAGTIKMWATDDAVTTSSETVHETWKRAGGYYGEIEAQCLTLEDLFAEHGEFDFISIDAEGVSVDLMHRVFDLGRRPKCICVEHDERTTEILSAATPLGYACVYASGENLVLVRQ